MPVVVISIESAFLLCCVIGILVLSYRYSKPQRQRLHHVRVKSAHGVVTKLVLNDQQYEQFSAWLNGPDGVYEIGDERARVVLERRYVAAVEVWVK